MRFTSQSYGIMEAKAEMVTQRRIVKLVGRCPNCGESIDFMFTKQDIKTLLRRLKMPTHEANIEAEKELRERGVY